MTNCIKCNKQIDMAVEQNVPLCHLCRMEFKDFDKLVEFINNNPQHPDRAYIINSQITDKQCSMVACKPKSAIRDNLKFEIENLYRIRDGLPQIVKEELKVVESPISVVATP